MQVFTCNSVRRLTIPTGNGYTASTPTFMPRGRITYISASQIHMSFDKINRLTN